MEEYHRSLKQNASETRTPTTQTNHFVAALWTFTKLELLKVRTNKNHYALKVSLGPATRPCASWNQCVLTPRLRNMSYLFS